MTQSGTDTGTVRSIAPWQSGWVKTWTRVPTVARARRRGRLLLATAGFSFTYDSNLTAVLASFAP